MLYIRGAFQNNFQGSQISNFAENLRAQKPNKAQTKRENISSIQYFIGFGLAYARMNRSSIRFVL